MGQLGALKDELARHFQRERNFHPKARVARHEKSECR